MSYSFAKRMLPKFKKLNLTYLPTAQDEATDFIFKKIVESKKWQLATNSQVEKYVELAAKYEALSRNEIPDILVEQLTWPGREPGLKLEYLEAELVNFNYGAKRI